MTTLLDLRPDSDHPVLTGLAALEEALDQMLAGAQVPLSGGEYAALVTRLERDSRRLEAVKLMVMAAVDRAGAAAEAGFAGTEAWVARQTTTTRAAAATEVGIARELAGGGHDATAAALDEGAVSPAHAAVILHASRHLPDGLSQDRREMVESALVAKARRFDPDQLRREARRAIEEIEPDGKVVDAHEDAQLRTEEESARSRSRLTFHDNADGTTTGHFTLPSTEVAHLRKIIEAMTAPRRMPATSASAQDRTEARPYDWDLRRGLALAELLEHLPTDHLHHKTAATVVVTIDHSVLTGALKAAHLDTGHRLSSGAARRLACSAGIIPAVLGAGSVALDLGRESRLFSQAQRVAAGLRHDTCAADGCERPYAWCELHHEHPWSHDGRTDLANAIPLCHWHHQRIHDPGYHHRRQPDGSLRFGRNQ